MKLTGRLKAIEFQLSLRAMLKQYNIEYTKFAKDIGISRGTLYAWFHGKGIMSLKHYYNCQDYFKRLRDKEVYFERNGSLYKDISIRGVNEIEVAEIESQLRHLKQRELERKLSDRH